MRVVFAGRGRGVNEWRHINEGLRCERYGQLSKAASQFAKALSINPHNGTALMHIAGIHYQAGRYGDAARRYEEIVESDPSNIDALQGLGLSLEKQHKYAEALVHFERILAIDATYDDAVVYSALCRSGLGGHGEAVAMLDGVISRSGGDHVQAHYCRSRVLSRMRRDAESISALDDARKAEARQSAALYEQGKALSRQKKHEKAVEVYTRALRLNPENVDALVAKGWTLDYAGLPSKDVVPLYEKAIQVDPHCTEAHLNLSFLYDRTGMYRKSVACLDRILEYDPRNVRALYSKGIALHSLKQHAAAEFFCDAAIRADPSNPKALCSMVWVLEHRKRHAEALEYCDLAIDADPEYAYAHSYRGKLLYLMGRHDEALESYEKALALDPGNRTAEYYRDKVVEKITKAQKEAAKRGRGGGGGS